MNIVEFLRARLDEDEREAKVCLDRWIEGHGTRRRWDRQLREVEAKRRIIQEHLDQVEKDDPHVPIVAGERLLRVLATAVYRDHPDYDPAWKV